MALSIKTLTNNFVKKRKGKKSLFFIPFFFTFANAVFGLLSVIKTFECDFIAAAYCIIFAAIMDFFDGKLARAFDSTSFIGMELDSLCDAVSFCFAPAILLHSWYFGSFGNYGIFLIALYLCAGLLRLARFNTISVNKQQNITYFLGMPTTLAAFLVSTLIIRFRIICTKIFPFFQNPVFLFIFIAVIACLMVSPVKFLSLKKVNYKLLTIAIIFGSMIYIPCFLSGLPAMFIGILSYVASSVLYYIATKISELLG